MPSSTHHHLLLCVLTLTSLHLVTSNQPPRIINFRSTMFVSEDTPVDTKLGTLEAMDLDDDYLTLSIQGEIANLILRLERVDNKKADIILKQTVDRESADQYTIIFKVGDGLNVVQKSADLWVNDVNDNAPQFMGQPYKAEIAEDVAVGTSVFQVTARDPDSGIWGLVSYNLTAKAGLFSINSLSGVVTLKEALDYESEKFLQLEIMASDGESMNSTTDLIINVIDVQDTPPYFLKLPYLATVREDAAVGTSILEVTAVDGDRGVPNPVTYSFVGDKPEYFDINSTSGQITVAKSLDREDFNIRRLIGSIDMVVQTAEVTTTPRGVTTATARVTITVEDVNDQRPTFSLPQYTARVPENTQARIPITLTPDGTEMLVTDYDQGDNGRFSLTVEKDGQPYGAFEVVPQLVLNEAPVLIRVKDTALLDFETTQTLTFQIVARETNTAELYSSTATVELTVEDLNDNWPEFDEQAYKASIPENSAKDTYVTKVTANDQDSGVFGDITYSLRGSSSSLFRIDPATGEVYVAVAADTDHSLLDREKLDTLFVIVQAGDSGGLRSSVQLQVTLTDVNDNPPTTTRAQYEGFVKENSLTLERTVAVTANDLDLAPNNELVYSIVDGDADRKFSVDATSGEISVIDAIDFEAMEAGLGGVFRLTVEVTDKGTASLSTNATVVIAVEDQNDETPVFRERSYTAVIPENTPAGTTVTTVAADDADGTSPNRDVIYRIEGGARDKFRISPKEGVLTVETGADLDRDRYGSQYLLTVVAIDRGTPPRTASTLVNVTITDINNKMPVFSPVSYTVALREDALVGQLVYTYTASDLDKDALLVYSLVEGEVSGEDEDKRPVLDTAYLQGLFGIHRDNGTVYVKGVLDRETVEEVTLTVVVQDDKAQIPAVQSARAKLTILLEDVNDNPPRFVPDNVYLSRISEASQPGSEVKQVLATDLDKTSGLVSYYLVYDSPESKAFQISDANRRTGVVTLLTEVDHERTQLINLTVKAEDAGVPPLSSTAMVYVEVEDVNDNSPEWVVLEDEVDVWENSSLSTVVTTVMATDEDSGVYGQVTYHMTGDNGGKFAIDENTGEIRVVGPLDRETRAEYRLTIEARDNVGAVLSQRRKTPGYVMIIVKDVNDFVPQFEHQNYTVKSLQENVRIGGQVITVRATDDDDGDNGRVQYYVDVTAGNATDIFDVEASSGVISVKKSLQGYVGWRHLVVIGRDMGTPALSSRTNVYVYIEDVNDHKPEIVEPKANHTIFIMENIAVGARVVQVIADDKDEGTNGEVRYSLVENPTNPQRDWLKFNITPTTGVISTAVAIDREQQETYYLEVRAYDLGKPRYEDRRTVKIQALDIDDNPPQFSRVKYPLPYQAVVQEEMAGVVVDLLNLADDSDTGNNSVICYYIVGGEEPYWQQFALNKTSGALSIQQRLDREKVSSVDLVVKASEDCWSDRFTELRARNEAFNTTDPTLLWVRVRVKDINDNLPVFTRKWFTAGVTRDTDFAEPVLNFRDYVHDPDEAENAQFTFTLRQPIRMTEPLKTQLRQREEKEPFLLGEEDGVLRTNIYFQQNMQGYFEFEVAVNDASRKHSEAANVSIYLLNEEQRAKVILRGTTDYVGSFKDTFAAFISNITGTIINVDKIRTHQDLYGKPDQWRVDMFIHAIDPKTGEVLDSKILVDIIDKKSQSLIHLFNQYNVIEIVPAVEPVVASRIEQDLQFILIIVAAALGVLLIILIITFIACRKKYKRKLKAATAMAFGSRDSGLNRLEMPGTNLHSYEGSNPIWLEQTDNGWTKESDIESKQSGNSLDENALDGSQEQNNQYDEQEMSLEMFNDEFDHFNKVPATKYVESDLYLQAALEERRAARDRHTNNLNQGGNKGGKANGHPPNGHPPNGLPPNGLPPNGITPSNGHSHKQQPPNGLSKPNVGAPEHKTGYDNITFVPDGYPSRHVDGLQTTDI